MASAPTSYLTYGQPKTRAGRRERTDVVVFRAGQTFGVIEYEDIGTPDIGQAQTYVTEAVNKVEGKSTVTPTTF